MGHCKMVPDFTKIRRSVSDALDFMKCSMNTLWKSFVVEVSGVAYLGHLSFDSHQLTVCYSLKIALFVSWLVDGLRGGGDGTCT